MRIEPIMGGLSIFACKIHVFSRVVSGIQICTNFIIFYITIGIGGRRGEDANSQIIGQLYMHFEHRILMDISGMLRPLHLKNSQGNLDIGL